MNKSAAATQAALITIACALVFSPPLRAQFSGGGGGVSQADLTAMQATIMAVMPQPLGTVPLGPNAAGVGGSGLSYVPGNAQQRQAVQRTVALTDASGNITVTWATSFLSSTPTVVIEAGNPGGTNGIICNWTARSASGMTGKCWQTVTSLIALLGITITVAPAAPASNTPVSVIMAEPTQ